MGTKLLKLTCQRWILSGAPNYHVLVTKLLLKPNVQKQKSKYKSWTNLLELKNSEKQIDSRFFSVKILLDYLFTNKGAPKIKIIEQW